MNIYQRINAVMQEVRYVKKDADVGNYKAVSHDQIVSVIRDALVTHGIVIHPEHLDHEILPSNGKMLHYSANYQIHFVNMDEPADRLVIHIAAHALDNGDKAPGKAVTYATKTAMLKVFCLETGENDESRAEVREAALPITDEQSESIKTLLAETESDVAKFLHTVARARGMDRIESVDALPRSSYDFAHGALLKKKEQM